VIALEDTGNLYAVREGAKLILGAGITLRGNFGNSNLVNAALVRVGSGGELRVQEGALISGNGRSGIEVVEGGVLVMSGGEVSGNYRGGVFITNGNFTMSGGSIIRNAVFGGVVVESGAFTMSGGLICGNWGLEDSGGLAVKRAASVFIKTGGVITGYNSDPVLGNRVINRFTNQIARDSAHSVCLRDGYFTYNLKKTVSAAHSLDSRILGYNGGWYDE
jgi:hypothetical protein